MTTSASGQYFENDPAVPSEPRTVELLLPDITVELATDNGVFSADQIDVGTKYLLLEAPAPDPGVSTALDLGCGYGAIARTLCHRAPQAKVWAVDVNARARSLATENLTGCDAVVAAPDDIPDDISFDLIWSNPPIRIGKSALHELLERWVPRLRANGSAILVVQKHLGADSLATWMNNQGWPTERIGSRRGFRLLETRPS